MALPTALKNHLKVGGRPRTCTRVRPRRRRWPPCWPASGSTTPRATTSGRACTEKTGRVLDRIDELGLVTLNSSGLPIIELPLGDADDIDAVGRFLFDRGIYVTLAAYPLVPKSQVGFRIQMTAANADDEIEQLNEVLGELAERFDMQRRPTTS